MVNMKTMKNSKHQNKAKITIFHTAESSSRKGNNSSNDSRFTALQFLTEGTYCSRKHEIFIKHRLHTSAISVSVTCPMAIKRLVDSMPDCESISSKPTVTILNTSVLQELCCAAGNYLMSLN